MIYQKNSITKKSTLTIFFSITAILFISGNGFIYLTAPFLNSDISVNETELKCSDYWNFIGTPINIDANWAAINISNDWCNGAGTLEDPYIIENVTIDAQNSGSCITIQNSVDYFIIRNCTLIDGGQTGLNAGIYLNNVQNGLIENNTCYYSRCGIVVQSSSNVVVKDNVIHSSTFVGIYMYLGSSNDAINNKITGSDRGLSIFGASNMNFSQNEMINTGIHVFYNSESDLITNHIDTTNTASGKPVYYMVNLDNLDNSYFTDPGQIILVNCDNAQISGFNIDYTNLGMQILYCNDAKIFGNSFFSNSFTGILVRNGSFNNFTANYFESCSTCMEFYESVVNSTIDNNTFLQSSTGIYMYSYSEDNTIINNNITRCSVGMYLSNCGNNVYENNDIIDSTSRGIEFSSVVNSEFVGNRIDGSSSYGLQLTYDADDIEFQENIIKNSGTAGVYIINSNCENNMFIQNQFQGNEKHVIDEGTNNNYNNSVIGNYWDNYTGLDANDDKIGDTPHLVQTANSIYDYLPIWDDGYDNPIPIHVDNNWTETVNTFDWVTGSGTWADPYIIEDITIDGQDKKSGIYIENTDEYFIIRNCTIHNTPSEYNSEEGLYDAGIAINHADNGMIYNNTIYDNGFGAINLQYADNHTIFENNLIQDTIVFNQYLWGIYNYWCNYIKIINNTISANAGVIGFTYCTNMTLRDNIMERGGFHFRGATLQHVNTHYIPLSNTIDGKTLYYYKNRQNLSSTDFQNAFQIILANCHDSSIEDLEYNNPSGYQFIDLLFSYDIVIQDCNFTDVGATYEYINLDNCNNITIQYNRFYNEESIYMTGSSHNTIRYNEFTSTSTSIIVGDHSDSNKIHNNKFNGGSYAVFFTYYCDDNEVYNNEISGMSYDGVRIWRYSTLNQVYQNNITNCNQNGIHIHTDCHSNTIQGNRIISNTVGIYIEPGCTQNFMYNNIFELNGLHAEDNGNSNYWNSTTIGNYWDNYTGYDLNDDLLGDTPHPIVGSAIAFDYLPICDDGDNLGPVIIITSPSMDSYHSQPPTVDVIITDPSGVHETWYTIIGSGIDHPFTGSSFIVNMTSWIGEDDGNVTIRVYGNDTLGNLEFTDISIYKDTTAPVIIINDPASTEFFISAPDYDLDVTELNMDTLWYTINGGVTNFTITSLFGTIDTSTWNILADGMVTITFYANDTAGNIEFAEVSVYKDTVAPAIIINYPIDGNTFNNAPDYDIDVNDDYLDAVWYTIGGSDFIIIAYTGTIDSSTWNALEDGVIIITFYAEDLAGNLETVQVSVNKDTTTGAPGIPGYDLGILLLLISLSSIVIFTKRKKLLK